MPANTPDYENPPVVETILGVQFEPLATFKNGHLGAFWTTLDHHEWPSVADAPVLAPQFERFGESAKWGGAGLHLKLSQEPASRLQITRRSRDQMLQLQNGRLHFNWMRGHETYPRYPAVRAGFVELLQRFQVFLENEQLGAINPNQWEVTYVNHIPKGTVWNNPDDWGFCRLMPPQQVSSRVGLESFEGEWHFLIPTQKGRLHVRWQYGQLSSGPSKDTEVVVLTLTARGPVPDSVDPIGAVLGGLDLGHETIVESFRDFASEDANRYWEIKNAGA